MIFTKLVSILHLDRNSLLARIAQKAIQVILEIISNLLFRVAGAFHIRVDNLHGFEGYTIPAFDMPTLNKRDIESKILISIIVPMYNSEKTIRHCVESVLTQLLQKNNSSYIELIIINDGSTDGSLDLLKNEFDVSKFTIINQPNGGFSSARNAGLQSARGRWVYFLDSDDFLLEDSMTHWLQDVEDDPDLVQYSFATGTENEYSVTRFNDNETETQDTLPDTWSGFPWGKLIRRSLFQTELFPTNYWFEDTIIAFLVLPSARIYKTSSFVTQMYVINPNGITATSKGNIKCLDTLYLAKHYLKICSDRHIKFDSSFEEMVAQHLGIGLYGRLRKLPMIVQKKAFNEGSNLYNRYFDRLPIHPTKIQVALKHRNFAQWIVASLFI